MRNNPYTNIARAALAIVLDGGRPVTARSLRNLMNRDIEFVTAKVRAFDVESGMNALQANAVRKVLVEYGPALGIGGDAEHVAEHTPETLAREIAKYEQLRAQLEPPLIELRAQYAQMTLESDLARIAIDDDDVDEDDDE